MILRAAFIPAIFLSALVVSQSAHAAPPDRREIPVVPSISTDSKIVNGVQRTGVDIEKMMRWGFLCYAYRHGRPASCRLRSHTLGTVEDAVTEGVLGEGCTIDVTGNVVPGSCGNGGHKHMTTAAERPRLRIFDANDHDFTIAQNPASQEQLVFTSFDESPFERFKVSGELPSLVWSYISGPSPDNAGSFYWRMEVEGPPCHFFPQYCGFFGPGAQEDRSYLADGSMNVRFDGLSQLHDDSALYQKVRGTVDPNDPDDFRHLNAVAFAGTPRTRSAMRLIAQEYKTATKNRLQPNDMSLPYGGLFDVEAEYKYEPGGHRSHRNGQDIDFNQRVQLPDGSTSQPVRCEVDKDFHEAVHKVLAPYPSRQTLAGGQVLGQGATVINPETAVLCESAGRKHVDVTHIIAISPFAP